MKKILLLLLIIISVNGLAQFPATQSQGTINTKVVSNGGFEAKKGLINGVFADTTAANADYIDFYNGAQIYTRSDRRFWLRDSVLNMWIRMAKFSEVGSNLIFNESVVESNDSVFLRNEKYEPATDPSTYGYADGTYGYKPVAKYNFTGLANWDLLRYNSSSTEWVNYKSTFISNDNTAIKILVRDTVTGVQYHTTISDTARIIQEFDGLTDLDDAVGNVAIIDG